MKKAYRGLSDSQANAEALARRGTPYAPEHGASVTVAWDYRKREPSDLREAVRMVRRAYSDEVPDKLHEHAIGEDGTPRMTARAVGYIFGNDNSDDARRDAETGTPDLVGYYHTPFRATLDRMERSISASERRRARIVAHVTIGQQGPQEAAIAERAHPLDAKLVAEDAIRGFLRQLSDIRIHAQIPVAESVTAA